MNVCFVNFTPYGTQGNTDFHTLSQTLARQGEDVTAIGIQEDPNSKKQITRLENGVTVHELPIERDVHSTNLLSFCKHAQRIIAANSFDVVHVFSFRGAGLLATLAKVHNRWPDTTWIYHLTQVSFNQKHWKYSLSNELSRWESTAFDQVLSYNDAILKEVYGKSVSESETFHLLPIGVEIERFKLSTAARHRRRHELGFENEILLVSVGTLNSERNISAFLHGFADAIRAMDISIHLIFIGDGNNKQNLIDLSEGLNIANKITFLGRVPFDEIPEYLSAADIGISHISPTTPQRIQPPLKVPEYLANGVPVLATATAGNKTYIEDSYNGLLYNEEIDSISSAIQQSIIDETWKHMRDNCMDSAQRFSIKEIASELIIIYENSL